MLKTQKARDNLRKAESIQLKQLNDRHTKRLLIQKEIDQLQEDLLPLQGQIATNAMNIGATNADTLAVNQNLTQEQISQKEIMEGQLNVLENQLNRFFEVKKLFTETFDKFGGDALTSIIEGESGSDALKKMAEGMRKESSKMLSDMIMTPVTGKLKSLIGMDEDAIVELTPEALAIQEVHQEHVTNLREALEAHAEAFDKDMKTGSTDIDNIIEDVISPKDIVEEMGFKDIFDNIKTNIMSAFSGIGGGGGIGGFFSTLFGMADGGVIGLARGGIARYAHGGIAKQPTYLVGEGKKNEAVVPLPDNKSIPVDLGSGVGNTNNTNITVNIDDSGATSTTDSEGGAELGKAINMAVQSELERQMRPGGILAG